MNSDTKRLMENKREKINKKLLRLTLYNKYDDGGGGEGRGGKRARAYLTNNVH